MVFIFYNHKIFAEFFVFQSQKYTLLPRNLEQSHILQKTNYPQKKSAIV